MYIWGVDKASRTSQLTFDRGGHGLSHEIIQQACLNMQRASDFKWLLAAGLVLTSAEGF
jgi:hypothetical protein